MLRWTRTKTWWIVVLAIALHLPSLGVGFLADDYVHQWRLEGGGLRTDLYDFGAAREAAQEAGVESLRAWWMSPDWELTFVRPLTSLSIALDHLLFGDRAALYHLENLFWFGLCAALLMRVLRDLGLTRAEAHLAGAIFALSKTTMVPVGWIANRNSLLELTFGMAALAALGSRPGAVRTLAALALALLATLAKESGIVFVILVGFLAWRRGPRFAPFAALAVLALAAINWVACGLQASNGFYPDPLADPLAFLARYVQIVLTLPVATLLPIPTDLAFHFERLAPLIVLIGLPLFAWVVPMVRAGCKQRRELVALLVAWILLAGGPQANAPLSDRLHVHLAPAWAGLLAIGLVAAFELERWRVRRSLILALALPASALSLLGGQVLLSRLATESRVFLDRSVELADGAGVKRVVLVQAPNPLALLAPAAVVSQHTGREDIAFLPLQLGGSGVAFELLGEGAVRARRSSRATWAGAPMESVFLTDPDAPREGFTAERAGVVLRVEGRELDLSWTGPAPLFLVATREGPRIVDPALGSLTVPAVDSPLALSPP